MAEDLRVVIAGGGRVGTQTARILDDRGHDVVVVEDDPDLVEELSDAYVATVIEGDATRPSVLEQTGLDRTDVVAALTGRTGINLAVCMAVRQMTAEAGPPVRTVARIDEGDQAEYTRFVDEVVFPEQAGARVAANEIVGASVQTLADVTGALDVMEVEVAEGAPAAGRSLEEIRFPSGTLVVSDDDGERVARPDTVMNAGRRYVVAVEPDVMDEVMNLLRG
jgi:trk system potassium uptake protein TrkA